MIAKNFIEIAVLCLVAGILTGAICFYAENLGKAARLLDRPDGVRKLHKTAVPLIGGLAVFVPSFAVSIFYVVAFTHAAFITVAIVAAAIMLIVGVADDRVGLSPAWRFVALLVICLGTLLVEPLFVLHTLRLGAFGHHIALPLDPISIPVTVLMLIGFINATNMADGMNGQLLGSVAIWCSFISYYLGADAGLPFFLVACSAAITFVFNLRDRLFSGSSGAYAASLFVGLGAIAAYRSANGAVSADMPLVWFWLPVVDCLRVMTHRILMGRSPFAGDRHHIHHILMDYMPARQALIGYLGLLAAPGFAVIIDETFAATVLLMCTSSYATLVFFHYAHVTRTRPANFMLTASPLPLQGTANLVTETYPATLEAIGSDREQQLTLALYIEPSTHGRRGFINGAGTMQ